MIGKRRKYEDHLDFTMLTPSRLSKPLMITSQLFLPIGLVAVRKGFYGLSCFMFPVCFTSIWHWHDPKTSSTARTVDIMAVFSAFCYGTYTSFLLQREITILWCLTGVFQACIFSANYVLCLYKVEKPDAIVQAYVKERLISGEYNDRFDCYAHFIDEHKHHFESSDNEITMMNCINLRPTWPMTRERELVYNIGVYVHMVCIHIIPCSLAIYCLVVGERRR